MPTGMPPDEEARPSDLLSRDEMLERVRKVTKRISDRVKKLSDTHPDIPVLSEGDDTATDKPPLPPEPPAAD